MFPILLFFILFICLFSCTKTTYVLNNSKLYLLTQKQWIVDSIYSNYNKSNAGTLVYSRGSINNIQDYSTNRVVFWPDGKQDFFTQGTYNSYLWSFTGPDSTEILVINTTQDYARILKLDPTHLTLYDSTNSALAKYIYFP